MQNNLIITIIAYNIIYVYEYKHKENKIKRVLFVKLIELLC